MQSDALAPDPDPTIEAVRRFSRFYTKRIGALGEGLHGSPFSLPEARVFYEVGSRGSATAGELARDLELDPGYMSRLVKALEERGHLVRTPNSADGRQMDLALADAARPAYEAIVAAARREIGAMLAALGPDERDALVGAMRRVERLIGPAAPADLTLRPHRPGDMGWVVERHGALYAREYGLDSRFEALVAEIVAKFLREYDPDAERCWIAERDGERVGCVFVVRADPETAKLRLLLVDPAARGLGLGRRLVDECLAFARAKGYRRMVLWTNDPLVAARHIYERAGFTMVEESRHADFGPEMTGQTWTRDLD
ncbi:bifunctional helix-turn-helix transcriptional regulator/GNAT family N-acetyltransferase [Prosthecomicrobium sp. N25]|uniref:bifunctional helix-turn-helix transcriptional regulator/GNAT family N-acetyltransferase n=1 Tax=Prosthecomicrobium sp. N25 TaxID=3129254 RepID=UPI003077EA90